MGRTLVEVILTDHDYAWRRVTHAIDGLTEDEFRWQPVAGALTLKDLWPQAEFGGFHY